MTAPFVKWAGGKRQLLPQLFAAMKDFHTAGRYFEPFVGGGALFFAMRDTGWDGPAVLSDLNSDLIRTYTAVRDVPGRVVNELEKLAETYDRRGATFYYEMRALTNVAGNDRGAARFIFLNKTCYNGLYRVNKAGAFNVPHGKFKSAPVVSDPEGIFACSKALQKTELWCCDFAKQTRFAQKGDLVYFDPPYVPASESSDFTRFTKLGFGPDEQRRLAMLTLELKRRGVRVMLSNADTPAARKLYDRGFTIASVKARRSINSKTALRGPVGELIVT